MASQRDIRRRIRDVGRIKQITRAMQFVAASKLRRAQQATLAARPYREKLDEVIADLATVLSGEDHPLLAGRDLGESHSRLIVLMTSDRGLAGALNTNTVRFAAREITEHSSAVSVTLTRAMLWRMLGADHPMEAHKIDSRGIRALGASADAREGVKSFLEKRPAKFPNRVSANMPSYFPWWQERKYS